MRDQFQTFFELPTARNYRLVRELILSDSDFQPYSLVLTELADHCRQGHYGAVRQGLETLMPQWALSPRAHWLAAQAALGMDDPDDAELERFLLSACLEGLLATGDGSSDYPYLVTYPTDADDVLRARHLVAHQQLLVECEGGRFDVVTCEEGCQVWFDVTDLGAPGPHVPLARPAPSRAVGK